MFRLHLIIPPLLLALALPGWAEARAAGERAAPARPLNLSLPRDVVQAPGDQTADETVERNLREPLPTQSPKSPAQPGVVPYGAGYEFRHQEMGGAGAGAPPGAGTGAGAPARPGPGPGGSSGAGRRGR